MCRITSIFAALALLASAALAQPEPPAPPRPPRPPRTAKIVMTSATASFLGVGVTDIDAERAKALKLKEERGVEVKSVDDESPAAKAGIKVNDVILEYNGQRVEGNEQFRRLVSETPVGRQVRLSVSRGGAAQTLTATVGSRPAGSLFWNGDDSFRVPMPDIRIPEMPRMMVTLRSRTLGVETESLNPQLSEYFGVKEGALVRAVTKGTAAEKAGLKAGDVITKIGDRKVSNPRDISNALRETVDKTFSVIITRERKEMTLSVVIEDKSSEHVHSERIVRLNL